MITVPSLVTGAVRATVNNSRSPHLSLFRLAVPIIALALLDPGHGAAQPIWTKLAPVGSPVPGRETPSAVYDPSSNRLILFGGLSLEIASDSYNEVWVLANANGLGGAPSWTQLSPSAPFGFPPGRSSLSAVYDPASNRMIVFGGGQFGGSFFNTLFNDTWVLTNANGLGGTPTWLPLSPVGGPPAPRAGQVAVYDTKNNRMIVFGGGNNGIEDVPNDVWVLSNANGLGGTPTWTQLSPAGAPPSPREHFAAGYDPKTNRMMIFGGCCFWTNDTFVLTNANGLGGQPQWMQVFPTGTVPDIRNTPAYGYDPASNFLLIFGMQGTAGPVFNDTWELLNANDSPGTTQWMNLIPNGAPNSPPIISGFNPSSASGYDAPNQRLISLENSPVSGGGATLRTWVLALNNPQTTCAPPVGKSAFTFPIIPNTPGFDSCPPQDFGQCQTIDANGNCLMNAVHDNQDNQFQLWCMKPQFPNHIFSWFSLIYLPAGGAPKFAGKCRYEGGQDQGLIYYSAPSILSQPSCFIQSVWQVVDRGLFDDERFFAPWFTCRNPDGSSCQPYSWTYTFDVASDITTSTHFDPSGAVIQTSQQDPLPDFNNLPPILDLSAIPAGAPMGLPVLGDVNVDGRVDCADLKIVQSSFGKRNGDPGFVGAADINRDNVVDIRDLAIVARQLPVGTVCH